MLKRQTASSIARLLFPEKQLTRLLTGSILGYLLLASSCQPDPPQADSNPPGGQSNYAIVTSIEKRYGSDQNGNGVIDMPNTAAYVQGPLHVSVDATRLARSYPSIYPYASAQEAAFDNTSGPWRWTFSPASPGSVPQGLTALPTPTSSVVGFSASNDGTKIITFSNEPTLKIELFEGSWTIELARMANTGNAIYWKTDDVVLNDALIVQLGDSYSSGEGAPDRSAGEGFWGDDGTGANGDHANANRSSNTWGSKLAQDVNLLTQLFGALSGSGGSVTYVNLAESGALIDDIDAQLDRLTSIVGPRKVDVLLISIGGNDAGFSSAIAAYLLREPIIGGVSLLGPDLSDIEGAIQSGDWTGGSFTDVGSVLVEMFDWAIPQRFTNVRGLNGLAAGYLHLASEFTSHNIDAGSVYILQYPDPLVTNPANPDDVCPDPILTTVASFLGRQLEIGRAEQRHARTNLILPINQQIASSAGQAGWKVINAETVMYGHAICENDRMVLRFKESKDLQGDKKGTLHPNKKGYEAIAKKALSTLSQ